MAGIKDIIFRIFAKTDDARKKLTQLANSWNEISDALGDVKKAWEFGKQIAANQQLEQSFNLMNQRIFQTPDLLNKMTDAANGTIDKFTLMSGLMTLTAGQSDAMSRRFAEAAPQLLEIAKASNKLNPALGDTAFLYESIATGIKRGSPLILDNLGIVVKVGEAQAKYAAQLGKTTEALSGEEKITALLNATLESGNKIIEQVGGNTESVGDSFAQFEVTLKEVIQQLGGGLLPILKPVIGLLGTLGDVVQFLTEDRIGKLIEQYEAEERAIEQVTVGIVRQTQAMAKQMKLQALQIQGEEKLQGWLKTGIDWVKDLTGNWGQAIKTGNEFTSTITTQTEELKAYTEGMKGVTSAWGMFLKEQPRRERMRDIPILSEKTTTSPGLASASPFSEENLRKQFKTFDIIAENSAQVFYNNFSTVLNNLFGSNSVLQQLLSGIAQDLLGLFAQNVSSSIFSGLLSFLPGGPLLSGLFGGSAAGAVLGKSIININVSDKPLTRIIAEQVPGAINRGIRLREIPVAI